MADYYVKGIPDDIKLRAEAIGKLTGKKTLGDIIIELLIGFVRQNQGRLVEAGQDRIGSRRRK